MTVQITDELDGVDWAALKAELTADDFDNGRSPAALRRSFENAPFVALAMDGARCVGTARLLSDGVCNAYLVDVWTASSHRRRGIARRMVDHLAAMVPGQHIGLQVEPGEIAGVYESLGFESQPMFMSRVVGRWLDNQANRD